MTSETDRVEFAIVLIRVAESTPSGFYSCPRLVSGSPVPKILSSAVNHHDNVVYYEVCYYEENLLFLNSFHIHMH